MHEVLAGGDACCLAHRRSMHWIPAPGWWVHSDHQSCPGMWGERANLVFIPVFGVGQHPVLQVSAQHQSAWNAIRRGGKP